jgi:hypothetical protein
VVFYNQDDRLRSQRDGNHRPREPRSTTAARRSRRSRSPAGTRLTPLPHVPGQRGPSRGVHRDRPHAGRRSGWR